MCLLTTLMGCNQSQTSSNGSVITLRTKKYNKYNKIKCGMRRPSLGQNDGDLSRLTSSSSTTSPADIISLDSTNNHNNHLSHQTINHNNGGNILNNLPLINGNHCVATTVPTSTEQDSPLDTAYIPIVVIDPLDPVEWQMPRKRKERQDSTSSITQDRKLVRSNSEEHVQNLGQDGIRRVSSHEDFKLPLQENNGKNIIKDENRDDDKIANGKLIQKQQLNDENSIDNVENINEDYKCAETSPARSRVYDYSSKCRLSPNRDIKLSSAGNKRDFCGVVTGSEDTDGEHERRRNSERFSKARAPPGRKATSPRKPAKYIASKIRLDMDENVYKFDISTLKYERRGFLGKEKNDKFKSKHQDQDGELSAKATSCPDSDYMDGNIINLKDLNDENKHFIELPTKSPKTKTKKESLPWDHSFQQEVTPVVCQRFADSKYDNVPAENFVKIRHPPPNFEIKSNYGNFANLENIKTRELMQKITTNVFLSPEERLKQINKRLVTLKKRVNQFEERFEDEFGYRPAQAEKQNDKIVKNTIAEIHKLRKEKQQIKSDPMAAMGYKSSQLLTLTGDKKLIKMKETLSDIEKRLEEKRDEGDRPIKLEELSADQLMSEKTAVQRGLLYLESLFGRPNTREERDIARPLYDRYRIIKRLVNRNASLSGSGIGIPELPTILEHEAMAFTTATTTTPSTDITPPSIPSIVESPTDTSASVQSTDSTDTSSSINDNVHTLSIDELWDHLDAAREEKKQLRRTIKEFEQVFEDENGRKMLKSDRKVIEETYAMYKRKKAKLRLLDALVKKHMKN